MKGDLEIKNLLQRSSCKDHWNVNSEVEVEVSIKFYTMYEILFAE